MADNNDDISNNRLIRERYHKLTALKEAGVKVYVNDFKPKHLAIDLLKEYTSSDKNDLEYKNIKVHLAGRIMLKRVMGKASFVTIMDTSGKIQLYISRDNLAEEVYNKQFKKYDIGDIIGVIGVLFKTKVGELSIKVNSLKLLTKSLRPLPEKFHGLNDTEMRYRRRYLDLIINQSAREIFKKRSHIINFLRDFFLARNFLEVETPMMQAIVGGANAKPFTTFHNALNMPLFLRIAPELHLKRLLVGGFDRVFEINRNFRNEGLSTKHNPEFTMIEFYQAYANYKDLMLITEDLLKQMAIKINGNTIINYRKHKIDFSKPFAKLSVLEAITKFNPQISNINLNSQNIDKTLKKYNIKSKLHWRLGKKQLEIFEHLVEAKLIQPTFITEYPAETSPLARKNDANSDVADRFELFIGGQEIANGFSELNDPSEQAKRFKAQLDQKQAGDEEAMHFDADYIRALEYGMPPAAGQGIGIDRLVMLFTNTDTIKDVILFPLLKCSNVK